jgi:acetyl-CoA carboxylase carboxyl transferase subunit beta
LGFNDTKSYASRLKDTQTKLSRGDAIICGEGLLFAKPVQLGVFNFDFMGGSMGTVVGEKIARLFDRAFDKRQPAIIVSSSGGARMQEGILSLMQMAKTCTALSRLRDAGVPFISVLTHPTTGGVAASFAMLGDVNIGEPGALIGFAGPRVIQQTIGEELPKGFQRSEYLLEHGMLDMICHRDSLRPRIGQILKILFPGH